METIVEHRRTEMTEKGETQMKTIVEKRQIDRSAPKAISEQHPQEVIARKTGAVEQISDKPKKGTESSEVTANQGLCATCHEAAHCAYARNATGPILFCEMFDEGRPEEQVEADTPRAETQTAGEKRPAGRLKGLCINCDHRETCTFPKPEGGVWHCQEYR